MLSFSSFALCPSASNALSKAAESKAAGRQLCAIGVGIGIAVATSLGASPAIASSTPSAPTQTTPNANAGLTFEQAMDVGYAASRQGDFNTALINFQRALAIRPNHPYAAAAADNMTYYIEHSRIAARQQSISVLEARLATATTQKDWVCAATTLDQLTTYTEPNSLNRERLIGLRGEVSGLLDARIDYESWSTICAAQHSVH